MDGCRALTWYKRAAEKGDKRSIQRLKGAAVQRPGGPESVLNRDELDGGKSKDCIIM